jgi:DNA-binding Lrp family transcriptional regulator
MPTSPAESFSPPAPIASGFDARVDGTAERERALSTLERRLLDEFQRDFPLVPSPFEAIASRLGVSEAEVIDALEGLEARGCVSRVGPVFAPRRLGYSMLAALAVPARRLDSVAALVNRYPEVNHNYEREHDYNLWFVVTGNDEQRVEFTLGEIEQRTGLKALRLPLERAYHIDLGFPLWP